ncbi:hypothetical protein Hanom_Chr01g00005461 [Helianthus anomalus]
MSLSSPKDSIPKQIYEVLEASMAATPTSTTFFYMSSIWVREIIILLLIEVYRGYYIAIGLLMINDVTIDG